MFVPMLLEGDQLIIVVVIIVVLIFGASRIPTLAKSLGRASGEFQKGKVEAEIEVEKLKREAAASQPSDHDKLLKAASELGISTEGKTDDQIRSDIKAHLS